METNETILTREVVVIDSHKKIGSVKSLRVDCDSLSVSHYIINNEGTGTALVLPFEKALAVGDTFVTVQNRDDFLAANDTQSNKIIQEGYVLLNEAVFSKTGNKLSPVKSFEFDAVSGEVTKLLLEDRQSFSSDSFVFFTPEFVFIDDGALTAAELRSNSGRPSQPAGVSFQSQPVSTEPSYTPSYEATPVVETPQESVEEPVVESSSSFVAESPAVSTYESSSVTAEESGAAASDESVSDDDILEFLIGGVLQADVESDDGQFRAAKGTELTREIIVDAANHDAILLLTINVEA